VGSTFNLNDKPFTVVGIAPPAFFGDTLRSSPPDFFIPLNMEPYVKSDADLNKVSIHWLELIGRIEPGANPASIEANMRVELKQWLRSHWDDMDSGERERFPEQTLFLAPGGAGISSMRQEYERWLQVLMLVSSFALLIVCANVANLMLVRGMERRQQLSLSMALGAQPSRLVKQALTESILLSLAGGAAGLAVAYACTTLILHFAFRRIGDGTGIAISASPSLPVLLFAFAVSLFTGIAFGIAPAWMATRVDPIDALRGTGRATARMGSLPRKTLVVLQAALSLVLLTASGLMTLALQKLENENFGFQPDGRLIVTIDPRFAGYRNAQLPALYASLQTAVPTIPGVSSAALCLYSPQGGGGWGNAVWVDGAPEPGPRDDNSSGWNRVSAGYFETIGTPILEGRGITVQDTASSRKVAVISEAFARKFFRNEDPLGKHFGTERQKSGEFEVVGVARDARYWTYNMSPSMVPMFFLAETQADYAEANIGSVFLHDIVLSIRPGAMPSLETVRQAIASVDPNLPIIAVRPLREQVAAQFNQQRLMARLTSFFGLLSLVLASIGLYGVTAYNAGLRANEIGVRLALGATRGQAAALILRGAFALVAMGLLFGLPVALGAGRLLGSQLYGMKTYSSVVLLAAMTALAISAFVAALLPAVRASLISPSRSLRSE
jgi:predicted permease